MNKLFLIGVLLLNSCCYCQQYGTIPPLRPMPKWLIETDSMSGEKYIIRVDKDGKNGPQFEVVRKVNK